MPIPADFPRLKLCEPCSRLFTDYEDGSIQFDMWYEEDGYDYTRIRQDLERAAVFGCVFCKAVASHDLNYTEDSSEHSTEICFNEPRPTWYPPLDEELKLQIRYNWVDNILDIGSRSGIEWSGGGSKWSIYTTPSKFGHRSIKP